MPAGFFLLRFAGAAAAELAGAFGVVAFFVGICNFLSPNIRYQRGKQGVQWRQAAILFEIFPDGQLRALSLKIVPGRDWVENATAGFFSYFVFDLLITENSVYTCNTTAAGDPACCYRLYH